MRKIILMILVLLSVSSFASANKNNVIFKLWNEFEDYTNVIQIQIYTGNSEDILDFEIEVIYSKRNELRTETRTFRCTGNAVYGLDNFYNVEHIYMKLTNQEALFKAVRIEVWIDDLKIVAQGLKIAVLSIDLSAVKNSLLKKRVY